MILEPSIANGLDSETFLSNGTIKNGVIKATPGQFYGLSFGNINAAACYVKLYNQTTAPTSDDTPVLRFAIPGSTAGGVRDVTLLFGRAFSTGIAYRVVTTAADNGDTATASAEVTGNFYFK